ncbi:G-type lectin S-receptor-like serine/threonine-protein kinase [Panicum miliaceum]|uniref:non-specific serine/threonine protein kinase n=1 Tax=Panicum miliaceum TaxID=4540 RepID=A0A3L6QUI9_PANMI|nr:G-type lectin S-receptor-like serine/threonine-protein kinase [Panicum miliaceum]
MALIADADIGARSSSSPSSRSWPPCSSSRARAGGVVRSTSASQSYAVVSDRQIRHATVERFLWEIRNERLFRFTPRQVARFTRNYSTRLGAGGFATVSLAEVGTIGRTHHINLVRLFGFCFDDALRALVYEYMEHGALDRGQDAGVAALCGIAVGVARGIRYLHEECQQKIVHYDIKPGNVLLDGELTPKVADFGLARLVNRADTHVSVSCVRGTPGFAAPEMWMMSGVTEKCDVYSFRMLLLEIVGRRRNFDDAAPESQQWFPKLAFWCVQQPPEARPPMRTVVKMLEGEMEIAPPANPFQHLMAAPMVADQWTRMTRSANSVLEISIEIA